MSNLQLRWWRFWWCRGGWGIRWSRKRGRRKLMILLTGQHRHCFAFVVVSFILALLIAAFVSCLLSVVFWWIGWPGERADPARGRGPAGKPEEDHNSVHDQIREGQSAGDTSPPDSVSVSSLSFTASRLGLRLIMLEVLTFHVQLIQRLCFPHQSADIQENLT